MNSSGFAKLLGVHRSYVTQLVTGGVIERSVDGEIDEKAALAAIAARRDPARALRRGRPVQSIEAIGRRGKGTESLSTLLLKNRIKTEEERGRIAELNRREREGELLERCQVEEAAFTCGRNIRDALMNIPARVSTLFAAETDPRVIHQALEDEFRKALLDVTESISASLPIVN
jgi:phage terminase Nu1 subunit (DNA packaging protein)